MELKTIGILGGTGFVGTHLVNHLTKEGYRLRVLTRHRERHRDLLVIPTLELIQANVHDARELNRQLAGCDAVINLVGILNERGDTGIGFREVHVELARKVIEVCRANGIQRLLHMSALNADAQQGPSHYLKTKGEAEDLVHRASTEEFKVTSFRPSVIFGPEDDFFNRFARLLKLTPFLFPLACPQARFAPVYVGNVTEAFVRCLIDLNTVGQRYNLCGPHEYTLKEIVEYTARTLGLTRRIISLNEQWSQRQARFFERLPGKPFSLDNYRSLTVDSVCKGDNGLITLGIEPIAVEAVVPSYLGKRSQRARYSLLRSQARRE